MFHLFLVEFGTRSLRQLLQLGALCLGDGGARVSGKIAGWTSGKR